MKQTGTKNINFNMEEHVMSKSKRANGKKTESKKVEDVKKVETPEVDERQVRKSWLDAFCAPKSSASRCVTFGLLEKGGKTIAELQGIAKAYNEANGGKAKWGSKRSDLTGHFRWLKNKNYQINLDEKSQKYSLSI